MKHHYVYKITCRHPRHVGEEYIGMRGCDCPIDKDPYMGSGVILKDMQSGLGMQYFDKEILSIHPTKEAAAAEEARLVTPDYIELPHVLNLMTGGGNSGIPGEETRQKLSDNNAMKRPEVAAKFKGENSPMKRPEVAAKVSEANTGENNAMKRPEVAAKVSEAMTGENNPMKNPEVAAKVGKANSKALTGRTSVYYIESRKTDCIPKEEYHRLKAEGKVIHVTTKQYRDMKSRGLL